MQPKTFIDLFSSDFIAIGADRVARCRKPTLPPSAATRWAAAATAMMCDIIIAADTANSASRDHARHHPGIGGTSG